MKQSNYYTPDIEDIRVGYECEIVETSGKLDGKNISKIWTKYKVEDSYDFNTVWDLQNESKLQYNLRTPYLTKEQIEAEGWELLSYYKTGDTEVCNFRKVNYSLYYNLSKNILYIILSDPSKESKNIWEMGFQHETFRFFAECKDINTFRYICKLLNIK